MGAPEVTKRLGMGACEHGLGWDSRGGRRGQFLGVLNAQIRRGRDVLCVTGSHWALLMDTNVALRRRWCGCKAEKLVTAGAGGIGSPWCDGGCRREAGRTGDGGLELSTWVLPVMFMRESWRGAGWRGSGGPEACG